MVRSLKILGAAAAAAAIGATSAFTAPAAQPASFGLQQSRPLSPAVGPLHASASVFDAPATGGGVILDRPEAETETQDRTRYTDREMLPNGEWILRIYNDNVNTREYVAVCLVQVVGLCEGRAYHTMQDAHRNGIAKVGEYNQEVAECYEEQLGERGIVCDVVMENGGE